MPVLRHATGCDVFGNSAGDDCAEVPSSSLDLVFFFFRTPSSSSTRLYPPPTKVETGEVIHSMDMHSVP